MLFNELVRGAMVGTIRPGTIDKGLRSLWQSIPRLSGGFIRITTNGGDDLQKTVAHCLWQRRPSVDHALKIRWNGYVLVQAMRRIMRRFF